MSSVDIEDYCAFYDHIEHNYHANNSGLTEFLDDVILLDEEIGSDYAEAVYEAIDAVVLAKVQKLMKEANE
jgi:hypothetical protein